MAHRIPYPPNKGDKIRSFNEIKFFGQRHEIHLLAFFDQHSDLAYADNLKSHCRSVTLVPLHSWPQRIRAARSLVIGEPWTLGYFKSRMMKTAVGDALRAHAFDLVFAFSSSMAPYARMIKNIPKVLDFVDSDACKWQQYAGFTRPPATWLYSHEARCLARFEKAMTEEFDRSVFVSPRETKHLANSRTQKKLSYIQNGIDLDFFAPSLRDSFSHTIIFLGAMNYFPNVDAVIFFAREVFPRVKIRIQDARFLIVGSNPAAAVRRLAELPGVTVTGTVEDVRPYLAQARVGVVPIRISQGIQNKILEALATGIPVVTTPVAAEGLAQTGELPLALAQEPAALADEVVRFLSEPPLSSQQIESCRQTLRQNYDWRKNLSSFEDIFQQLGDRSRAVDFV